MRLHLVNFDPELDTFRVCYNTLLTVGGDRSVLTKMSRNKYKFEILIGFSWNISTQCIFPEFVPDWLSDQSKSKVKKIQWTKILHYSFPTKQCRQYFSNIFRYIFQNNSVGKETHQSEPGAHLRLDDICGNIYRFLWTWFSCNSWMVLPKLCQHSKLKKRKHRKKEIETAVTTIETKVIIEAIFHRLCFQQKNVCFVKRTENIKEVIILNV